MRVQAASSAARGDGEDAATFAVAIKLSEDDCGVDMDSSLQKYLQVFNGELVDAATGAVEPVKLPIRDPAARPVADDEFVQLAGDGHVVGVQAFLEDEASGGRVDEPRDAAKVSGLVWVGEWGCRCCVLCPGCLGRALCFLLPLTSAPLFVD